MQCDFYLDILYITTNSKQTKQSTKTKIITNVTNRNQNHQNNIVPPHIRKVATAFSFFSISIFRTILAQLVDLKDWVQSWKKCARAIPVTSLKENNNNKPINNDKCLENPRLTKRSGILPERISCQLEPRLGKSRSEAT